MDSNVVRDNTKDWDKNILRDKTFNEQPMDARLRVAKNYYFRNVASKPDVSHQSKKIKDKLEAYFYETAQVIDEATFREIFPEYDDLSNEEVCDMRDLISFIFPIFTPLPPSPWQ